jgi:putative ABC transport system substrate-binding protein
MQRREFITLLGGAAAASPVSWPLAAHAQQPGGMRRIGVLMAYAESDSEGQAFVAAFREGLQKLGWAEGRNIRIDARWAMANVEAMQRFARELVALQPDLILSHSTPSTAALLQQTRTIPVIFANVSDPVGSGFVASLPRPGGNVTGFMNMEGSMGGKWLELLKEIAPRVNRVAFLFNPATAPYAEYYLSPFKAAAPSFAVEAIVAPVHNTSELESVIAAQAREPNGGLIVMPEGFMNNHPSMRSASILKLVACCPMAATPSITFDAARSMPIASSRASSRASFRSRRRSSSKWSSTPGPPRRSASKYRRRSTGAPTR